MLGYAGTVYLCFSETSWAHVFVCRLPTVWNVRNYMWLKDSHMVHLLVRQTNGLSSLNSGVIIQCMLTDNQCTFYGNWMCNFSSSSIFMGQHTHCSVCHQLAIWACVFFACIYLVPQVQDRYKQDRYNSWFHTFWISKIQKVFSIKYSKYNRFRNIFFLYSFWVCFVYTTTVCEA